MALPRPIRAATLELTQARLDVFDPADAVELLVDCGINTVVSFALGYGRGEAYYASAYAKPHPCLNGRDLLGDVLEVTHRHGLAFCAYVNSFFGGPEFHVEHPEWTQKWADGSETVQGDAKALCINSPYRQHIIEVSDEVAGRYPIDAFYLDEPSLQSWCACKWCAERFELDTSFELPRESQPGTRRFAAFMQWRSDVVTEFIGAVGEAVRQARPGVEFFAQHAFPLASTAPELRRHLFGSATSDRMPPQWEGWYRPAFYGQDIVKASAQLDLVGLEPWRRFVDQPVWWEGVCVSYARAASGGKTVLPLMEYPHFPWGLSRLSDDELAVNCADVTANGGDLWFPMYAPDAADRAGWRVLGNVFRALDGALPLGSVSAADVAVLVSRRSAERYGQGKADRRYLDDLTGVIQLVRELHLPYRILSAETLDAAALLPVRTLLVPSAACLDERECSLIEAWVRGGGRLIATGPLATHDETGSHRGNTLLADLIGARISDNEILAGFGYLVPAQTSLSDASTRYPVREAQFEVTPISAERVLDLAPSWDLFSPPEDADTYPSVTTNRVGDGIAALCPLPIGTIRRRFEGYETREMLSRLLDVTEVDPDLQPLEVGIDVALHTWLCGADLHVFFINTTSIETSGQVSSLDRQTIDVRGPYRTAKSVRGEQLYAERTGHGLRVELRRLDTWDAVVLSAAGD